MDIENTNRNIDKRVIGYIIADMRICQSKQYDHPRGQQLPESL